MDGDRLLAIDGTDIPDAFAFDLVFWRIHAVQRWSQRHGQRRQRYSGSELAQALGVVTNSWRLGADAAIAGTC